MTPDEIKSWSTVALGLWNICLTVAIWLRKPGEDAGKAVEALKVDHAQQLSGLSNAIVQIKTELEHMPTSEELAQLEGTVKQINERTAAQSESLRGVSAAVSRIEQYLLDNKR